MRHTNPYRDPPAYEEPEPEYRYESEPQPTEPDVTYEPVEQYEPEIEPTEPIYEAEPTYEEPTYEEVYQEPVYEEEPEPTPKSAPQATQPKTDLNAATVDVRTLELNFAYGSTVNLKTLKEKGLVLQNATTLKIVASTDMTKAMTVEANQFSLDAIRVITEAGGETIWIQ